MGFEVLDFLFSAMCVCVCVCDVRGAQTEADGVIYGTVGSARDAVLCWADTHTHAFILIHYNKRCASFFLVCFMFNSIQFLVTL